MLALDWHRNLHYGTLKWECVEVLKVDSRTFKCVLCDAFA